jgi:hypothetical protein
VRAITVGLLSVLAGGCSLGLGDPCDDAVGCEGGLICRTPLPTGQGGSKGICDYPSRKGGEPCTAAADCESQLTCSNHFHPGTRHGRCVDKVAEGEPCFSDRDCQTGSCTGKSGVALDGLCGPRR